MNIVINGSKGKMGQTLLACARKTEDIKVVGEIDVGDDLSAVSGLCHVVVDFSVHTATTGLVQLCAKHKKAMVIGTTGHSEKERAEIFKFSRVIPMVMASNFSIGVNLLFLLTRKTAEILGPDFDLEIVEMHHRLKKDAPSGTADTLWKILASVRSSGSSYRYGRSPRDGMRTSNEIGIHSIRGGDVVGDHTVIFAGNGERVELTHKASSRETFAEGALRAARWVVQQPVGFYDMQTVLFGKLTERQN